MIFLTGNYELFFSIMNIMINVNKQTGERICNTDIK